MLDYVFPRVIRFCTQIAEISLHTITGTSEGSYSNSAERFLGKRSSALDHTSSNAVHA